jgi:hypothetical protein
LTVDADGAEVDPLGERTDRVADVDPSNGATVSVAVWVSPAFGTG